MTPSNVGGGSGPPDDRLDLRLVDDQAISLSGRRWRRRRRRAAVLDRIAGRTSSNLAYCPSTVTAARAACFAWSSCPVRRSWAFFADGGLRRRRHSGLLLVAGFLARVHAAHAGRNSLREALLSGRQFFRLRLGRHGAGTQDNTDLLRAETARKAARRHPPSRLEPIDACVAPPRRIVRVAAHAEGPGRAVVHRERRTSRDGSDQQSMHTTSRSWVSRSEILGLEP